MIGLHTAFVAAGLLLTPLTFDTPSEGTTAKPLPVAQTLVREGDFAVELVTALELGSAKSEAEAENILASAGIAPKNGWIADYPVTPDIIGELQSAISSAAESGKISMGKSDGLKAFQELVARSDLSITPDSAGKLPEEQPQRREAPPTQETIQEYYYVQGPPVVTYYPPPFGFSYLYSWVPYPFFSSGFFFRGFFILNDFHRCVPVIFANNVFIGRRDRFISNHFFVRSTRRIEVIDPVRRRFGNLGRWGIGDRFSNVQANTGAARALRHSLSGVSTRTIPNSRFQSPRVGRTVIGRSGTIGNFRSFGGSNVSRAVGSGRASAALRSPSMGSFRTSQGFSRTGTGSMGRFRSSQGFSGSNMGSTSRSRSSSGFSGGSRWGGGGFLRGGSGRGMRR